MISLSTCPICSGQSFKDYLICKDHTTTGEEFLLKQCNFCDFVITDPQPDEQTIGKYYQSDKYISHTGGKKNLFDSVYLLARKRALHHKRQLIEKYSTGKKLLDFGCGTGEFLNEMKNHNWQITGVEPAPSPNQKASTLTSTKVYTAFSQLSDTKFDVITLWHVLEHLHDLNTSVKNFHSLLNDSGTIFVAVPNHEAQDARHYKSAWAAYDVPRHLWHFSKKTMTQLLQNNGFQLIDILPMRMDSYYVSILSEGYQNPHQSKIINLFRAFTQGALSNLKAKKEMNYSSLIYIARK